MILVAGGTGRLGRAVVTLLCGRGLSVRVLSRGLAGHPEHVDPRAEQMQGDVRDPASLLVPMAGVNLVVSAVQGFAGPGRVTPESVDHAGNVNLIEAAERTGAHMILVSTLGAAPESPMALMRAKYAAEQRLRSGTVAWTIVRPEASAETWIELLEQTAIRSHRPLVFGRGDNPVRWVGVADVAALVDRVVADASLRGRVLEICGPEDATLTQLAEMVMAQRGWIGTPRRLPRPILHVLANTAGNVSPQLGRQVRGALAMDDMPVADDGPLRAEFPDLPRTHLSEVLVHHELSAPA